MPLIPSNVTLTPTLNPLVYNIGFSVSSVDWIVYDGTTHRPGDTAGFSYDASTGVITLNFAPNDTTVDLFAQVVTFVPDGFGAINGTLTTSGSGDDIRITRGQDVSWPLSYSDSNGLPYDLTSVGGLYLTVKRQLIDSFATLITKSILNGGIVVGDPATAGIASVAFVPADTASLDEGRYMYDKWLVTSGGLHYPAGNGAFVIEGRATIL
jgi:hypothetical protein